MTFPAGHPLQPLTRLQNASVETPAVFKETAADGRPLAEMKGVCPLMPNEAILSNTLVRHEAKHSSAIENIVTTHDELFRASTYPDLP